MIAIRYQCHHCAIETISNSRTPWTHCPSCDCPLGFDWLALSGDEHYQRWLAQRALQAQQGVTAANDAYMQSLADADACAKADPTNIAQLGRLLRLATDHCIDAFPFLYPHRTFRDSAYRQLQVAYGGWSLLQQRIDAELKTLALQIGEFAHDFALENPLATLEPLAQAAQAQSRRLFHLSTLSEAPAEPENRPAQARQRLLLTFALGGYLPHLSSDYHRPILALIHGQDHLVAEDESPRDDERRRKPKTPA